MNAPLAIVESAEPEARRAEALYEESQRKIHVRTDQMFEKLMVFQWLAGIVAALWISPFTWIGATGQLHWHVLAAIFLGGVVAGFPVWLIRTQPGGVLTRHVVAVGQILFSALLIHLTGGRIETHFHIFGSLAFLAFYRDWRVLVTATVVVATDHFVRGTFWPESVFGVLSVSHWRWVEHAGWVVFEDVFLIISIRQSVREMRGLAQRQASLEFLNAKIEQKVTERTAELTKEIAVRRQTEAALVESQVLYHSLVEQLPIKVYRKDAAGRYVYVNSRFCQLKGLPAEKILGQTAREVVAPEQAEQHDREHELIMRTGQSLELEEVHLGADGTPAQYFQVVKLPVRGADNQIIGSQGVYFDITQRKQAQARLDDVNRQLVEASRRAGMADVATSVLHNVGNVLNSINVSSSLLAERIRQSKLGNVTKVVALMQAHEQDLGDYLTRDPKGRQLPGYLVNLSTHLAQEQADLLAEVESLLKNIIHIKEIVAMQQGYARISGVMELLPINELVEDSIRMNTGAMDRHKIQIVRELTPTPPVSLDKHKVLQILVNLIRNAKCACDESGRTDKQIVVRVSSTEEMVAVTISDNGVGIAAENLTRIFSHGFTTRAEGHGFGLHSGALAAKEMGGRLLASSEGPGKGAAFTLEIPRKRTKINP
jgi:PAS domain S-box-containing protein